MPRKKASDTTQTPKSAGSAGAKATRAPRKAEPAAAASASVSAPVKSKKTMSSAHKSALQAGRAQGRAVRLYLEALAANQPKRGRKRTADSVKKRLEQIDRDMANGSLDVIERLSAIQERLDLQRELERFDQHVNVAAVEEGFVSEASSYGARKGISYSAWRELGVSSDVLRRAGISRKNS